MEHVQNTQPAVSASEVSIKKTRRLAQIAMLGAAAGVLMFIEFPLPFLAPPFYKMDFSELPVLIGGFAMGPVAGILIEIIKIALHLLFKGTSTAFVGELGNLIMGCAFIVPAAIIYKRRKTRGNAIIGMVVGIIVMAVASVLVNAYMLLPAYCTAFHIELDVIIGMGAAIHSSINSVMTFCILAVAPFNIFKGVVISILTMILYKHIRRILK